MMPEIAHTKIGRNALFSGLISHLAALLVAMLSSSGTDYFFSIVFPFSCLLLIAGAYAELKNRGYSPFKDWRFYLIAAVTVFPLLGPFIILGLLYRFQKSGQEKRIGLSGLFTALFRLKANVLVIFLLLVFLLILFVFTNSQDDPYYKKRHQSYQNRTLPQSILEASQCGHCAGKSNILC
jgi:hypothetical protein